jgi:hypothetical protein
MPLYGTVFAVLILINTKTIEHFGAIQRSRYGAYFAILLFNPKPAYKDTKS